MVSRIFHLGLFGLLQLIRSRIYVSLIAAAAACVLLALLLDVISAGEGGRMLLNIGLWCTSLMAAAIAGIMGIILTTQDISTKQIHQVIARPLMRIEILLGRFLTIFFLVFISNLALGLVLESLLFALGSDFGYRVIGAALFFTLESCLIAAVAIFFGIGSSGTMSTVFTLIVFILGRLSFALGELIHAGKFGGATRIMELIYLGIPQLHRFNLTEWAYTGKGWDWSTILSSTIYGVAFITGILLLSGYRFERKDIY